MNKFISKITRCNYITNVYGISRSLLAMGLLLTLIFNSTDILFQFDEVFIKNVKLNPLFNYNYFYIFRENLLLSKLIAILILLTVIIGIWSRYTVVLHWWLSISFFSSALVIDGGDQISAILTLLLIPFGLVDNRKWHWSKPKNEISDYYKIFIFFVFITIRVQASVVYFFSAALKMKEPHWQDGTVLYYWFTHPVFGANDFFYAISRPLIESPLIAIATWSVIILEVILSMALVMKKNYRKHLFVIGVLFHFSIILIHGLFSFFFSITALLIIYLLPIEKQINFNKIKKNVYEFRK
ncbi:sporulation-delaying protein SdpB family protein [Flavobacterium sp. CS20]|uniref:sporulation-delaying protein SdpB family protein n=1 Tax=Flavobacterium sp. CS20 TaxID=2775246 RepID=UPI001B3A6158|nr:sporulation-delaying protein SdpB family protein [Flavobacterium sp. CS20]QTY27094.1 hypothetical protein IGB25_00315 [Flavobacterium sp. CS20]